MLNTRLGLCIASPRETSTEDNGARADDQAQNQPTLKQYSVCVNWNNPAWTTLVAIEQWLCSSDQALAYLARLRI